MLIADVAYVQYHTTCKALDLSSAGLC